MDNIQQNAIGDAPIAYLINQVQTLQDEVKRLAERIPERYSTIAEAAEQLGVCKQTIRRKVAIGEIKSKRVGRSIRVIL
jgi:excisionase family DNA binding protein